MFNRIGKKIKTLAKVYFWILFVYFILAGIAAIVAGIIVGAQDENILIIIGGILGGAVAIGLGYLISWVGVFFIYGYGEMIDSLQAIKEDVHTLKNSSAPAPVAQPIRPAQPAPTPYHPVQPVQTVQQPRPVAQPAPAPYQPVQQPRPVQQARPVQPVQPQARPQNMPPIAQPAQPPVQQPVYDIPSEPTTLLTEEDNK